MNPRTQKWTLPGPVGILEGALDLPESALPPRGLALVCHPHPLHGGTMDNKVVQTVARALLGLGWRTLRFNFRGVAGSEGAWDEGRGEIDDAWAVLQAHRQEGDAVMVAGFSFGAYVASHVAHRLQLGGVNPEHLLLVGPAVKNFSLAAVPQSAVVIHGESDDVVPLSAVMDWARPQTLPVTVVPGVGHFFHGQLPLLKHLVSRSCGGALH